MGHAHLKNEGNTEQSVELARFGVQSSLAHSVSDLLDSRLDVLGDRNRHINFYDANQFEFVYCNFFEELSVWLDVSASVFLQTKSSSIQSFLF